MKAVSDPLELRLQHLADLSDDELAAAYTPEREPWLRVNFVSTVDGAATGSDGLSGTINNDADKRVFDTLRRRAHCLVVGAGTIREEEYDVPRVPIVVVSRSADVPPTLAEAPPGRVLMATVATSDGLAEARASLGEDNVLVLGEDQIDLVALKAALAERGWTEQLCEGGPLLFADMLAAGVVDELCRTLVPRLTGGGAVRIATGAEVDVNRVPPCCWSRTGTLLGRWLVEWTSPAISPSSVSRAFEKAGMSSGLRLAMRLPSTTTSSSTHSPPPLRMSVCRLGQLARRLPFTRSASTRVQGAWQMAATGLPESTKSRMNATASSSMRRASGLATPPGRTRAS